ncbi:hypothetical protein ACLOJK_034366 [Asimina triloba]
MAVEFQPCVPHHDRLEGSPVVDQLLLGLDVDGYAESVRGTGLWEIGIEEERLMKFTTYLGKAAGKSRPLLEIGIGGKELEIRQSEASRGGG